MNNTHDKLIISILLKSNGAIRQKYLDNKDKYINLTNYLNNRYEDSDSLRETVARMRFNVEQKPLCPVCGKKITFKKVTHNSYIIWNTYCSMECSKSKDARKIQHDKMKQTNLERYGVENPFQSEQIKDKIKQTCLEKYGVENAMYSEQIKDKIKQTNLERYGVENAMYSNIIKDKMKNIFISKYGVENPFQSNIIKEKIKQTNLERYGVENPLQSDIIKEKIKQTNLERYGVEHSSQSKQIINKIYITKKKNHTFNSSKPEEYGYKLLYNKFGFCNIKRQYKSDLYPFYCDFYIKSLDLYIEFNFYWTHGKHKFDSNNKDDVNKLNDLKIKYNNGEHPLYKGAILTWTKSDPKKFNTAKKNNLNYLAFYNWNEFLEWYKLI